MNPWIQAVVSIVTITGSVGGAAYLLRSQRANLRADTGQTKATTSQIMLNTAGDWVDKLRIRISELEAKVDTLVTELEWERRRRYQLENWSRALTAQVIEGGGTPIKLEDIAK